AEQRANRNIGRNRLPLRPSVVDPTAMHPIQGRTQMNIKILGAVAAVALLAACATQQAASTGSGAQAAVSGPVPGSEEDLVRNVGDRVFYDFDKSNLKVD